MPPNYPLPVCVGEGLSIPSFQSFPTRSPPPNFSRYYYPTVFFFFQSYFYSLTNMWLQNVVLSHSIVSDSVTPQRVAHQTPRSRGFSGQEYWNGLPFPSPWWDFVIQDVFLVILSCYPNSLCSWKFFWHSI